MKYKLLLAVVVVSLLVSVSVNAVQLLSVGRVNQAQAQAISLGYALGYCRSVYPVAACSTLNQSNGGRVDYTNIATYRSIYRGDWTFTFVSSSDNKAVVYVSLDLKGNMLYVNNGHIQYPFRNAKDPVSSPGISIGPKLP
jgi:hypothetical protein